MNCALEGECTVPGKVSVLYLGRLVYCTWEGECTVPGKDELVRSEET